jgi:ATP-dependent DNA ligase
LTLAGFVAKHHNGQYLSGGEERSWLKIRNQRHSQMMGRNELFDRKANRQRQTVKMGGWASCVLACAEAEL